MDAFVRRDRFTQEGHDSPARVVQYTTTLGPIVQGVKAELLYRRSPIFCLVPMGIIRFRGRSLFNLILRHACDMLIDYHHMLGNCQLLRLYIAISQIYIFQSLQNSTLLVRLPGNKRIPEVILSMQYVQMHGKRFAKPFAGFRTKMGHPNLLV